MEILVISDSHGRPGVIPPLLALYKDRVKAVLHTGDHDMDLLYLKDTTDLPLEAVAGNTDNGLLSPREKILTFGGKKIFMTHGSNHNFINGKIGLINLAVNRDVDICLFGHSHVSEIFEKHGIFFMNPGSLKEPRDENPPSYGLLKICEETGLVSGEIIFL